MCEQYNLQSFNNSLLLMVALVNAAGGLLTSSSFKHLDRSPELGPALGDYCVKHSKIQRFRLDLITLSIYLYSHEQDGCPLDWLDEVAQLAEQPVLAVLLAHDTGQDVGHHVPQSSVTLLLLDVGSSLKKVLGQYY